MDAIGRFWTFWKKENRAIARSFSGGMSEAHVRAMNARVRAIHPNLDWEFGPGHQSEHHLCLSGRGDPVLRAVAERWRASAPKRSALWEFHAARQPHPKGGLRLEIGGHDLNLDDLVATVAVDQDRERLDITAHHPVFNKIADENLRERIVFIGLETLLGEDAVERWIGWVALHDKSKPPRKAMRFAALPKEVARLAKKATGDSWVILQGERDGKPIFVSLNRALKRVDHLALDRHLTITIRLRDRSRDDGLTTNEEAEVLNVLQDDLEARLGDRAVFIARETWNGRRILHLHAAWTPALAKKVEVWRRRPAARAYSIRIEAKADPRWEALDRWSN